MKCHYVDRNHTRHCPICLLYHPAIIINATNTQSATTIIIVIVSIIKKKKPLLQTIIPLSGGKPGWVEGDTEGGRQGDHSVWIGFQILRCSSKAEDFGKILTLTDYKARDVAVDYVLRRHRCINNTHKITSPIPTDTNWPVSEAVSK